MKNAIFNVIFFATMLQMASTSIVFYFMEDRVMEFSTDRTGLDAFGRFLDEFDDDDDRNTFRKQLALMHYMEGLAAFIIVIGMFLLGNYRVGHLFAATSCGAFYGVSMTVVDTVRSYPQVTLAGNDAFLQHAPQGILIFAVLSLSNFVAFALSDKPFFPSPEDCAKDPIQVDATKKKRK